MTTLVDALAAILIANWGAGGGGGVVPATIVAITDYRTLTPARDSVDNIYLELGTVQRRQVNNNYCDVTSTVLVTMTSATSDDRLKTIVDECRWVCNNVAVTGVSNQKVRDERDKSDRVRKVWVYEMTVECIENLASSSSAYASGTATTFTADHLIGTVDVTTAALTVSGAATVGSVVTAGNVDGVDVSTHAATSTAHHALTLAASATDVTATAAQLNIVMAQLMVGTANAAWIPCMPAYASQVGKLLGSGGFISNVDASDVWDMYYLPLPMSRGGLNLHITGGRLIVNDADADDYVSSFVIYGMKETGATEILNDLTNREAQGDYEYVLADTDVSSYDYIAVFLERFHTNAADLDVGPPLLLCFYDT